jgi:hypothetical protein
MTNTKQNAYKNICHAHTILNKQNTFNLLLKKIFSKYSTDISTTKNSFKWQPLENRVIILERFQY